MNYKQSGQIMSISRKSDSKTLLGQLGDIVRVVGSPFLALKSNQCRAESTTHTDSKEANLGHYQFRSELRIRVSSPFPL